MSERSRSSVELEPVTCWPLILGAIGFVSAGILLLAGFAAWSALFPAPKPAVALETAPEPEPAPMRRERIELPAPPVAPRMDERVVKVHREVVHLYRPMPAPRQEVVDRVPPPVVRMAARPDAKAPPADRLPTYLKPLRGEEELRTQLWEKSIQIDLETTKGTGEQLLLTGKKQMKLRQEAERKRKGNEDEDALPSLTKTIRDLLKSRSDLQGLPVQDEKACQSGKESAKLLREVSVHVRSLQARADRARTRRASLPSRSTYSHSHAAAVMDAEHPLVEYLTTWRKGEKSKKPVAGPLEQMFQIESAAVRGELITTLAAVKDEDATRALARRAVFDLSSEVRAQATKALKKRSLDDARPIFQAALRHPWAPVADHAAVALVALNDKKAAPLLEKLLDQPDPSEPFKEGGKWYVRDLVRVNHLRNCLLCHSPSTDRTDPVIGPIPTPGQPLPVVYYSGRSPGNAVRADIVYFRQDFSVMHAVDKPNKWPAMQRFDYLVRKRELTAKEARPLTAAEEKPTVRKSYPQREAVQYALHALARRNASVKLPD
jgi:hypothetical protein